MTPKPFFISGWVYLAFAFYHTAAFMLCFFHVLHADLYGFDKRINTFWCMYNFTLALFYLIGTLGNVLWFPSQVGRTLLLKPTSSTYTLG